jgi:hypothetical protein
MNTDDAVLFITHAAIARAFAIALRDGACIRCLNSGLLNFPLDPRHHAYREGHIPVISPEGRATLAAAGWPARIMLRYRSPGDPASCPASAIAWPEYG